MATPTIIIGDTVLLGFAFNRARIEELVRGATSAPAAPASPTQSEQERLEDAQMEKDILRILRKSKTIAIVGLSPDPKRASLHVAEYLRNEGYRIIPVNPTVTEVLGLKSYPDLASVPGRIDVVDIFRRPEYIPAIVEEAIAKRARAVWMQQGIRNDQAAERARAAGLMVVMDRCIHLEHARLKREGAL